MNHESRRLMFRMLGIAQDELSRVTPLAGDEPGLSDNAREGLAHAHVLLETLREELSNTINDDEETTR